MRKIPHEQLQQTIAFRNTWIRLFTTKRTSFINFFTRGLMIRAVKLSLDWIHGKLGEIYFMMKNIFHLTGQRTAFVRSAVWVWVRELLYLAFVKSWQLDFSIIKRFKTYLKPVWNIFCLAKSFGTQKGWKYTHKTSKSYNTQNPSGGLLSNN